MTDNIVKTIQNCCIQISDLIRTKHTGDLSSIMTDSNISGDEVKQLDILSNQILVDDLIKCNDVKTVGSEEEDHLVYTNNKDAKYLVCFDPLDGSSNIDCNITTGTIFGIYEYKNDIIENGHNLVAAGYCLYGGATQFIIANDSGVKMYNLYHNTFELMNDDLKMKNKSNVYSINESNKHRWTDRRFKAYVESCITNNYTARWVGSLVADAHRTIIKGGFFAYPADTKSTNGKLRVLYEAYPFAYIFEKAGGHSSNGELKSLLDLPFPKDIHQKTPLILSDIYEYPVFESS